MRALQAAMTPRFKTDATGALVPDVRAAAAIIFNPEHRPGALGGERAGQALDRQHHQGDDGGRVPRGQSGPVAGGHGRAQRRLRRVDDLPARERAHHARQPAAPHAHRVGQRRGARARADLARRHRRLRRADEREGARARPREHVVRRSVGPERRERLVGVRPLAAHHLRGLRRAHRADHADGGLQGDDEPPHDHHPQHQPARAWRRRRRDGRQDRLHQQGRATAWRRCCACRRAIQVAVVVLGANSNTGRFWETRHLFNWLSQKTVGPASGKINSSRTNDRPVASTGTPSASPPRPAAASRLHRRPA